VHDFYSSYTCGAEVLPNENIYLNIGGQLLEYDMQGNKVWEYSAPLTGVVFRTEKYALDYPAFIENQPIPDGSVELVTSPYDCQYYDSSHTEEIEKALSEISLVQTDGMITLDFKYPFEYSLYNSNGTLVNYQPNYKSQHIIRTYSYTPGLYIVHIKTDSQIESKKIFIK